MRSGHSGAFESLWRSELTAITLAGSQVTSEPQRPCITPGNCPVIVFGSFVPTFLTSVAGPGRLLYIGGREPERLHVTLRIRDVTRQQESLGTELPVVREDDAYEPKSLFAIPDIPRGANYRSRLRLYRIDTADPATLLVRFVNENVPAGEQTVTLSRGLEDGGFLLQPPYAEFDVDTFFAAGEGRRSIIIETPDDGLYWGFVSVTNNVTQQITTVTP